MEPGVAQSIGAGGIPEPAMWKERLLVELQERYDTLCSEGSSLERRMSDSPSDVQELRSDYASWLDSYERYMVCSRKYSEYATGEELTLFSPIDFERNAQVSRFKSRIDRFLNEFSIAARGDRKYVRSQRSVEPNSQLVDDTRRAELQARLKALKLSSELEEEELRLRTKRERLAIQCELDLTNARATVLREYEHASRLGDFDLTTIPKRAFDRANQPPGDLLSTIPYDKDEPRLDLQAVAKSTPYTVPYPGTNAHEIVSPGLGFSNPQGRRVNVSDTYSENLLSVTRLLKKPQAEIKKFSGDPIEYHKFVRHFTSKLVVLCEDDDEKLNYLEQYTLGEANKVVSGFSHLPSGVGFPAAMNELHRRYGNVQIVANAYIEKLMAWPQIKIDNVKGLDEFSIYLTECHYAIDHVRGLGVLEYAGNMKAVVKKLPYQLHDKWRGIVQRVYDGDSELRFKHLVDFVSQEARKGRDAVFGRDVLSRPADAKKPYQQSKSKASFGTNVHAGNSKQAKSTVLPSPASTPTTTQDAQSRVESSTTYKPECTYCKGEHYLSVCTQFDTQSHDDKIKYIQEHKLCFGCLKRNHIKSDCRRKLRCDKCQATHPTTLHRDKSDTPQVTATVNTLSVNSSSMGAGACTMAIVPVKVQMCNGANSVDTYAFLDPGSNVSFCTTSLLEQIGGSGKRRQITVDTLGEPFTMSTQIVKGIQLSNLANETKVSLPEVYTKDTIPVTRNHIPVKADIAQWSHLSDIPLPQLDSDVSLLIGNNVPDVYSPIEVRTGPPGSPHATRTAIGWIPWNVIRDTQDGDTCQLSINRIEVTAVEDDSSLRLLDQLIRSAIDYDFPERTIDDRKENSQEDNAFVKHTQDSIQLTDGHYEMKLPFRDTDVVMPENRSQAMKRLNHLQNKFKSNDNFRGEYTAFMKTLLDQGYAEKVPPDKLSRSDGKTWYLPHHGVMHPTKQKLRVVFDCAAQYQGVSLNQKLLQGPNLTNQLVSVLMKFREEPIAIQADIEAMFHQCRVPTDDRDYLRFLWWPNGDISQKPEEYRMCVHLFGATSSPSCANTALRATAQSGSDVYDSPVVETVLNNFYVDDCLKSLKTTDDAIQYVEDLTALCKTGGFNLTKWASNSREVLLTIPEDKRAKTIKDLDVKTDILPVERALGVSWDMDKDVMFFKIKTPAKPPTRRNVLSIISSVYDPLGFAAPCVLVPKLILRELCGRDWDYHLDGELLTKWEKWYTDLPSLENIEIPRCNKPEEFGKVVERQLHHFADASDSGYGTASYLRQVNDAGDVYCSLVLGKSRVAPLKKVTIPRMELTAARMAVQMNKVVSEGLEQSVDKVFYWTDSTSVLKYLANTTTRFHTFVANRVSVIREATSLDQWGYVPSADNPADLASRGIQPSVLHKSVWHRGPDFLWKRESDWLKTDIDLCITGEDPEVKLAVCGVNIQVENVLDRFSSYPRCKAVIGWILVFVRNVKNWVKRRKTMHNVLQAQYPDLRDRNARIDYALKKEKVRGKSMKDLSLGVDELQAAEQVIVKLTQSRHFEEDILRVQSGKCVSKSSPIRKLDPILVDGVLRVGGRLNRATISQDVKQPILVPKNSKLAELLVLNAHKQLGHSGKNAMLSLLRERFWIIGVNVTIKSVVSKCVVCRKYKAKTMHQKMADLPQFRLETTVPPFTNVGMDYFGPIEIKRGRSVVKRYGVIFTCLTTRAVHLEVADSLDTDSCINAIRRFIARRGRVLYIRSDNGSNLISANRELREEIVRLDAAKILGTFAQQGIKWEFNPPLGSHFGGVWERMIRSVRRVLYGLMKEQTIRLNDDSLATLFCEIESILNNRPLVEMSNSVNDLEALTPNHLLLLRPNEGCPPGLFDKKDSYVKRRWRQVQYIADIFWKRWVKEYLVTLQERQKWLKPQRNVEVGDIVLLVDNTPRSVWSLGRVLSVNMDSRGLVRSVSVKTSSNVLTRPVDKLCLVLECQGDV